jgi:hypothetical protein
LPTHVKLFLRTLKNIRDAEQQQMATTIALRDANEALTKRVNDLEEKVNIAADRNGLPKASED